MARGRRSDPPGTGHPGRAATFQDPGRRGGVATQRPAKPSTPVRFRSSPSPFCREFAVSVGKACPQRVPGLRAVSLISRQLLRPLLLPGASADSRGLRAMPRDFGQRDRRWPIADANRLRRFAISEPEGRSVSARRKGMSPGRCAAAIRRCRTRCLRRGMVACDHSGTQSGATRYLQEIGQLRFVLVCDQCGAECIEIARLDYRPQARLDAQSNRGSRSEVLAGRARQRVAWIRRRRVGGPAAECAARR